MRPGEQLKAIRTRLEISTRDVEMLSRRIADAKGSGDYSISNARLTQIENKDSVPSIRKLYSLATIMRLRFSDIIRLYNVDIEQLFDDQMALGLDDTRLAPAESANADRRVAFPIKFGSDFDAHTTALLSSIVETWGEVPVAFIQRLNVRNHHYGFIGLKDFTMYPLLRPGSFVQIDQSVSKVQAVAWRTEYERPIYFVELRGGFACCWCEMLGFHLLLVPHPLSPCGIRQYEFPREAEIVGRVTAIATRLGEHVVNRDG